jgi:hypothetical protein
VPKRYSTCYFSVVKQEIQLNEFKKPSGKIITSHNYLVFIPNELPPECREVGFDPVVGCNDSN